MCNFKHEKIIKKIFLFVIFVLLLSQSIYAVTDSEYKEQLHASGADSLPDKLPPETRELLERLGMTGITQDAFTNLTAANIANVALNQAKSSFSTPLKSISAIIGIILLCALLDGFKVSFSEKTLSGTFGTVSSICIATSVLLPMLNLISRAGSLIVASANFMLSYIPIFAAIMVSGGQPVTAGTYNTLIFAISQGISIIASRTLVPLMSIYLAFCLISSLSPDISFTAVAEFIQKAVTWTLGIILTVFVGLLTIQGVVGNAADTVAIKTVKFAVSGSLPVIGSIISDAVNSVQSCVGLLKTTVGAFGIVAAGFIYLPIICEIIAWLLLMHICIAIGDVFSLKQISSLLKSTATVIKVLLAIIVAVLLMMTVSTTIMLVLKGAF